jgi:DNA-binding MarR family transcriptional regulator
MIAARQDVDQRTPNEYAAAAMDSLRRIVRGLRLSGAGEGESRVSSAQLFVLRQIAAQPGLSLADLARRTATSQSSVSEVAARLALRGLVNRQASKDDRRRAEFSLTAGGERILAMAAETAQERLLAGFLALPPEQQASLARILESWTALAGLADLPPTMFFEPASGAGQPPNE